MWQRKRSEVGALRVNEWALQYTSRVTAQHEGSAMLASASLCVLDDPSASASVSEFTFHAVCLSTRPVSALATVSDAPTSHRSVFLRRERHGLVGVNVELKFCLRVFRARDGDHDIACVGQMRSAFCSAVRATQEAITYPPRSPTSEETE